MRVVLSMCSALSSSQELDAERVQSVEKRSEERRTVLLTDLPRRCGSAYLKVKE